MAWIRHQNDLIEAGSTFYNTGNLSPCCRGTVEGGVANGVGRPKATVLDNCVGFAVGAFNETFMKNYYQDVADKLDEENSKAIAFYNKNKSVFYDKNFPFNISAHAHCILDKIRVSAGGSPVEYKRSFQYFLDRIEPSAGILEPYIIPFEEMPPKGGLIMWDSCHVAYIDDVSADGNSIHVLHAGYENPKWTHIIKSSTGSLLGYKVHQSDYDRDLSAHTYGYRNKNGPDKCIGYLANPAISLPFAMRPPIVDGILQVNATKISIIGYREELSSYSSYSKFYYKWDGEATPTDYDGVVSSEDVQFSIDIDKPRSSKSVSVLPVMVSIDNDEYAGELITENLYESYPCISIYDSSGNKRNTVPHIYTSNEWKVATPTLYDNRTRAWYELYNTDREKVE